MRITNRTTTVLALLTSVVMLSGCPYKIAGTVTDLETGEALADVGVGMFESYIPVPHAQIYLEKRRTDSDGQFQFDSSWASRTFEAHAPNYQSVIRCLDTPVDQPLNVPMWSIAPFKGTWDATVTLNGDDTRQFQFIVSEAGMTWRGDGDEFDTVPLSIRAPEIVVDDYMAYSRFYTAGEVQAELALDRDGETITGTITSLSLYGDEGDSCNGTVVAIRAGA